ncbi:hypothetical protein ACIHCX_23715 [Streptomyces sp. NPDC052043]|uniref:hypothetical protein n=1 Tax=Streptomyces sp. NPDC052043 TaxID=3365684 RepID=UPI0037CFFC32
MQTRGRRIRFTAVSVVVVLALTGFSRSHGHGHGRHGSGGGGGCSNSNQNHDSSTSSGSYGGSSGSSYGGSYGGSAGDTETSDTSDTGGTGGTGGTYHRRPGYRSTPTPSSSGTGKGRDLRDATVRLISCATQKRPYATVEITNPNDSKAEFQAWVTFYDADGTLLLKNSSPTVPVPANGRATTEIKLGASYLLSADRCETDPTAAPRN